MSRRFAVLVNPTAAGGRAAAALPEVRAELDRRGVSYRVLQTRSIEHAREAAAEAAASGETVAALGGDGFVRPVAGALRDTDGALAVLPGGRGNDLARVLGVPRSPAAAAALAIEGSERLIDVAEVNGTPFVGIASVGFDSEANRIANEARVIGGNLVYLYGALRALVAWKPATFRVRVDGDYQEVTGYSAAVGNSGAYGGGMFLLPHAELDDGRLEVLTIAAYPKLRFLADLPKVFRGTHLDSPHARLSSGSVVELDADRRLDVYADGDPVARTPATVTVRRRCLRVIVPAEAPA